MHSYAIKLKMHAIAKIYAFAKQINAYYFSIILILTYFKIPNYYYTYCTSVILVTTSANLNQSNQGDMT